MKRHGLGCEELRDGFVNGVDEEGRFLSPDIEAGEDVKLTEDDAFYIQHWSENRDAQRLPQVGVEPEDLAQAGWAVIWGPDVTPEIRKQLRPLVEARMGEAGDLGKEYQVGDRPVPLHFLEKEGVVAGKIDPKKLPYYLLVVGDPARLPFEFQYRIDLQHAVGRLHFQNDADYGTYANAVLKAESLSGEGREASVWATDIEGDQNCQWMLNSLVRPVVSGLQAWQKVRGLYATRRTADGRKATLFQELTSPPAFLFTASHGMVFSKATDEVRAQLQGSLLCDDWKPKEGPPGPDVYFSAKDLQRPDLTRLDLQGLIVCHFACFSAGCSEHDPLEKGLLGKGKRQHSQAFVSALSQKLLTCGAQAVLGHVDRTWETTFSWKTPEAGDQNHVLLSTLKQLLEGHRIGHATEDLNGCYSDYTVELNPLLANRPLPEHPRYQDFKRVLKATLDARNFVVIGDPAVRLVGATERWRVAEIRRLEEELKRLKA